MIILDVLLSEVMNHVHCALDSGLQDATKLVFPGFIICLGPIE